MGFAVLPARDAPSADMEAYLRATITENADKFGGRTSLTHMNPEDWITLCSICSPGMHAATMNSLFTTMDLNHDDSVTENEIYSDGILGILMNRFNHAGSVHPLEGAYLCLPQPLFREDAGQVACIQELKAIWDTVVTDWQTHGWTPKNLKMVPDRNATPPTQKEPKKEEIKGGFFSSVFGSSKPAAPPPRMPFNRAAFEDFIPDLAAQCPEFDFTSFSKIDYRITDLDDDHGNFVYPINDGTLAKIKAMQQKLMEPHGTEPKGTIEEDFVFEIPGEGRSHKLAAAGVCADGTKFCQVDFKSVFASAVGRSLFSGLAREYEHIYIVGAPKFNLLDQSAEFRRFTAFSDLAYSKKARIYIQAECDAIDIFEDPKQGQDVESAGVVEDDYRTWLRMVSMLKEMRTSKYETVAWLSRNHQIKTNASQLTF